MFHYVACAWDVAARSQVASAERICAIINNTPGCWRLTYAAAGLRVFCRGLDTSNQATFLTHNAGVVLGALFHGIAANEDFSTLATLDDAASERIIRSGGRELAERYWGRYVAFLREPRDGTLRVVRSPTGELDCLALCLDGVRLFLSDTEGCPVPPECHLTVDWEFVAAELTTLTAESRRTGLRELQRVLHGECLVIDGNRTTRKQFWHPFWFAGQDCLEDAASAASELRRVTKACVGAWASCHESVLALLSGGLDSSILVSLLGALPHRPEIACVNYRNAYDRVADERVYARRVASQAGLPLVEREQDAALDADRLLSPRDGKPACEPAFTYLGDGWQSELARVRQATACFTGHGGDQLFFENGAYYVCADFVHRHGLRPRIFSVAMDAARIEGGVVWTALRRGLRDGLRGDPLRPVIDQFFFSPLIRNEVAQVVREQRLFLPGWFDRDVSVPPGKCWQIIGLSVHEQLYGANAEDGDPECVFPLLSQPLQELCLRIPTYVLTLRGRSRGLARMAFSGDVPPLVLDRRLKAIAGDHAKCIISQNEELVRDLLLEGFLAKERIINTDNLKQVLSGQLGTGSVNATDVMHALATECWLRRWHSQSVRHAA